jgi:hypothetical protein
MHCDAMMTSQHAVDIVVRVSPSLPDAVLNAPFVVARVGHTDRTWTPILGRSLVAEARSSTSCGLFSARRRERAIGEAFRDDLGRLRQAAAARRFGHYCAQTGSYPSATLTSVALF